MATPQRIPPAATLRQETALFVPTATKAARSTTIGTKKETAVKPLEYCICNSGSPLAMLIAVLPMKCWEM